MITGTILVHGLALLLNFDPYFYECYCDTRQVNCRIDIRYYSGKYRHVVYVNDHNWEPISGVVKYSCERK